MALSLRSEATAANSPREEERDQAEGFEKKSDMNTHWGANLPRHQPSRKALLNAHLTLAHESK